MPVVRNVVISLLLCCLGCAQQTFPPARDLLILVPGVAGDGPWYDGLKDALPIQPTVFHWGHGGVLFAMNFSDKGTHDDAEQELARLLNERAQKDSGTVRLIGHSAGCGVILGALSRTRLHVQEIILLAPSVSPGYDLSPALQQIAGPLHVFFSSHDDVFLDWRTSNFGTYDRVKTKAAGNVGFDLAELPPELRSNVHQHGYDSAWQSLGNDGGHFGCVSERFIKEVVAPLLFPSPGTPGEGRGEGSVHLPITSVPPEPSP
jgi:pimeloyl-ACP methyl ester carboxylesterase